MFSRHRSAAEGVTRSRSLKKTLNTPTAIKKNSHCLQLIYQVVSAFVEIQHSELLAKKEWMSVIIPLIFILAKFCQLFQAPIISVAGRAFIRPREDLRRVGDRLAGGLAPQHRFQTLYRPLPDSRCSRTQIFPRAMKPLSRSASNEGLIASYLLPVRTAGS